MGSGVGSSLNLRHQSQGHDLVFNLNICSEIEPFYHLVLGGRVEYLQHTPGSGIKSKSTFIAILQNYWHRRQPRPYG